MVNINAGTMFINNALSKFITILLLFILFYFTITFPFDKLNIFSKNKNVIDLIGSVYSYIIK